MRSARILGPEERPANYYHVMSRAIEGRLIFDDLAKERFRKLFDAYLRFSGIECVTFCLMGNHFHLLLHVPSTKETLRATDDTAFLKRLRAVHGAQSVNEVGQLLSRLREQGATEAAEKLRERFIERMHDLSAFMRELKQRFMQWHNRRTKRRGPLWQDRFNMVAMINCRSELLQHATRRTRRERVMRIELTTASLARKCSTPELHPQNRSRKTGAELSLRLAGRATAFP